MRGRDAVPPYQIYAENGILRPMGNHAYIFDMDGVLADNCRNHVLSRICNLSPTDA